MIGIADAGNGVQSASKRIALHGKGNALLSRFLCIGLALLLCGCREGGSEWQNVTVAPVAAGATVHVRVLHAVNPRLPRLTDSQLRTMFASAQATVRKNFGVDVEFSEISETGIDRVFALIPPSVLEARKPSIYDFKSGRGDRHRIAASISATLTQGGTKLEDALAFARPYLPAGAQPKDLKELSELLSDVMLERLGYWRRLKALDGAPVLDASPYNEWIYWDTLGYGDLQYDLVVTNQFIASAEYSGADIHSALRGGVSVGTTTYSRNSGFGSYIVWSTFPFTDDSDYTRQLRGGERYSATEAAELSGAYLAHEIGHMLFHFGHPFGQKACVMNPVSMLRFREWLQHIDSAACPVGSRPEMVQGAVPEYVNVEWLRMSLEPR